MATREQIREAVDNDEWQLFRLSMKGKSTEDKLTMLRGYWLDSGPGPDYEHIYGSDHGGGDCQICIQVDNYLKSLARGGQLYAGVSLKKAVECNFMLGVRK